MIYAAAGAGAVVMGLLSPALRERFSLRVLTIVPLVIHGLLIIVFAISPNLPTAAVLWGTLIGQVVLFNIVFTSVWQRMVPTDLLGRVSSVVLLVALAGIPLGAVVSGAIIDRTGDPVPVFAAAGAGIAIVAAAFRFSPIWEIDTIVTASP
jgi:predicted MFS family arabinose efflux permease